MGGRSERGGERGGGRGGERGGERGGGRRGGKGGERGGGRGGERGGERGGVRGGGKNKYEDMLVVAPCLFQPKTGCRSGGCPPQLDCTCQQPNARTEEEVK